MPMVKTESDMYGALLVQYTRTHSSILKNTFLPFLPLGRLFCLVRLFFTDATLFGLVRPFFRRALFFAGTTFFSLARLFFAGETFSLALPFSLTLICRPLLDLLPAQVTNTCRSPSPRASISHTNPMRQALRVPFCF